MRLKKFIAVFADQTSYPRPEPVIFARSAAKVRDAANKINKAKMKFLKKLFPQRRWVLLIRDDSETKIVRAKKSNIGWIANWYGGVNGLNDTWSILLSDGKTTGYRAIKKWLPHKGWKSSDLKQLKILQ